VRGGKRENAGRKKGSGAGRNTATRSLCLTKDEWKKIDKAKGKQKLNNYIRQFLPC